MALELLQNGITKVRGRDITVSESVTAKVTGLSTEGTKWIDKHVLLHKAVTMFQDPSEQLARTRKGIHPLALRQSW